MENAGEFVALGQIERCALGEHDFTAPVYTNFGADLVPEDLGCSECGALDSDIWAETTASFEIFQRGTVDALARRSTS